MSFIRISKLEDIYQFGNKIIAFDLRYIPIEYCFDNIFMTEDYIAYGKVSRYIETNKITNKDSVTIFLFVKNNTNRRYISINEDFFYKQGNKCFSVKKADSDEILTLKELIKDNKISYSNSFGKDKTMEHLYELIENIDMVEIPQKYKH